MHRNLLIPKADLKSIGAEFHHNERRDDITFRDPMHAVIYPIISLRDVGFGARNYVESLESAMMKLCSSYGVDGRRGVKGKTGVWVAEKNIEVIGVRISSGIASHGLSFNIDLDLNFFKYIVPCGIANKRITSLRRETSLDLPANEIIQEQQV
ncbi:Octanoyltransferase [Platanthera guangdongensis]|uniref:lipoyl(octanoyl) transferase n=1 Tax=Platanthera guangdongensis TaxID=2320717 RepID=A0ABR2MH90_9ASPA